MIASVAVAAVVRRAGFGNLAVAARRAGFRNLAAWFDAQRSEVREAWRAGALAGVVDYASGASRAADLLGFFDAGVPPGVSADVCSPECERELLAAAELGIPVFVDSGAYGEFTSGRVIDADAWRERLAFYARVVSFYGSRATVVAPDRIADQAGTLERLREHAAQVGELLDAGARVLVPLQGGELGLEGFADAVTRTLGRADWTPAFPFNRAPTPLPELLAYVARRRPRSLHLLGMGAARAEAPDVVDAIRAIAPATEITLDSTKLRAKVGTDTREGRPMTRALASAEDAMDGRMWAENDAYGGADGKPIPDYTDAIAQPSMWLSADQVRDLCAELQLEGETSARCREDLDAFLQEPMDPDDPDDLPWYTGVEATLDGLWRAYVTRETRRERRRGAVRETFGGAAQAADRPLRTRVKLVRAIPGDANRYFAERHYLHRGRTTAQVAYWILFDVDDDAAAALDRKEARPATSPAAWQIGGVAIAGALLYALPRVSAPRLYGYHPMELLELARLFLEPETPGGKNPRMLASIALGRAMRRLFFDWRATYPQLPAPKAVVSWADTTMHEGAIYLAAGFVHVGDTEGERGTGSRRVASGKRSTIRHHDLAHPKHAYVLPVVAPDPRTTYHARYILWGVCRESAQELAEAIRAYASGYGLKVAGEGAQVALVGTQRGRERGYDYMDDWHVLEVVIPLVYEEAAGPPKRTLQEVAFVLAHRFAEEAANIGEEFCADDPHWEWEIERVGGATYRRPEKGAAWQVDRVQRSTQAMGGGAVRVVANPALQPPRTDARLPAIGSWWSKAHGGGHDAIVRVTGHVDPEPGGEWQVEFEHVAGHDRGGLGPRLPLSLFLRHAYPLHDPIPHPPRPEDRAPAAVTRHAREATVANLTLYEPGVWVGQGTAYGHAGRWMAFTVEGLEHSCGSSTENTPAGAVANHRRLCEEIRVMVAEREAHPWKPARNLDQLARVGAMPELAQWLVNEHVAVHHARRGDDPADADDARRAEAGRLVILNMGAGRDSIAMLILLVEGRLRAEGYPIYVSDVDAVVFADTGAEWDHTILLLSRIRAFCERYGLRFLHLRKPSDATWRGWAEAQRAARLEQAKGWDDVAESELAPLYEARDAQLAEARRLRTAELRATAPLYLEGVRERWKERIAEIKRECKRAAAKIAAPYRYTAEQATWAYGAEGVDARAADGSYHLRPPILDDYAYKDTIACRDDKSCTANHKVLPIRRVTNDLAQERFGAWADNRAWGEAVKRKERQPHLNLIGLAADETDRLAKGGDQGAFSARYVTEAFPLAELGIRKEDEAPILERHGFGEVRKSGCWMCPHQPVGWWWALREVAPDRFAAAADYEERAAARVPSLRIVGEVPLAEAVDAWRARNPDATVDEVLSKTYAKQCQKPLARANPACPGCAIRAGALAAAGVPGPFPDLRAPCRRAGGRR